MNRESEVRKVIKKLIEGEKVKKNFIFVMSFVVTLLVFTKTAFSEDKQVINIPQRVAAIAQINSTKNVKEGFGYILLLETEEALMVVGALSGIDSPGEHGIHIHQEDSCGDEGKAAGGHFNPEAVEHGFLPKDGHDHAHVGDMGNILIDEKGRGMLSIVLPGVNLSEGEYNVAGKAIILHAQRDDFGQPTGNAGARIGCGLIDFISE